MRRSSVIICWFDIYLFFSSLLVFWSPSNRRWIKNKWTKNIKKINYDEKNKWKSCWSSSNQVHTLLNVASKELQIAYNKIWWQDLVWQKNARENMTEKKLIFNDTWKKKKADCWKWRREEKIDTATNLINATYIVQCTYTCTQSTI